MVTVFMQHIAEVGHRERVIPIMIGWVPVTTLDHQNKPRRYIVCTNTHSAFLYTNLASVLGCSFHLLVKPMAADILITACVCRCVCVRACVRACVW